MTLGSAANDKFRAVTRASTPSGSAKRVRCTDCGQVQSLGQYPIGSNICITCKPQGKNFRRGDL